MHSDRRAVRIRGVAIIVTLLFLGTAVASATPPKVVRGQSQITVTTQTIKQESFERFSITAFAIYNKNISPYAIGNGIIRCLHISHKRTLPAGTMTCLAVFRMPLGQIIAGGLVTSRVYYRLAIAGGTGAYANVGGGQVQVITTKLKPRKEQLKFVLYSF